MQIAAKPHAPADKNIMGCSTIDVKHASKRTNTHASWRGIKSFTMRRRMYAQFVKNVLFEKILLLHT
jgi:hypothetical protein